ncbi:MAG: lytic transglycosylase domain-containing protein [Agriterribacter sp.]
MIKMLLKGFGCFSLLAFSVISTSGKGIEDGSILQNKKDTSITAITTPSKIVVADVVNVPSAEDIVIMAKEKEASLKTSELKTFTVRERMFRELHPMSVSFVKDYQKKNEDNLAKIKVKYARQFALIDDIMLKNNLPTNLKYLAIIESELSNSALSCKGAVGPWQFMAETGRLMGLNVSRGRDERRDLIKSTNAAAKYLKSLYSYFNDWLLVIAAYNGGASRVDFAIKKSNSRDFWKLQYYLPAESRMHVKKFIAAQYVMEATDEVVPLLNIKMLSDEELANTEVVTISGKYNAAVIIKSLDIDEAVFNMYNPDFNTQVVTRDYEMRLPKDKMKVFNSRREDILYESVQAIMNENKTLAPDNNKNNFPDAISLPKIKAVNAGEQKNKKRA